MSESQFAHNPMFGLSLTIISYVFALGLHRRTKWLHPLFICSGLIIVVLLTGGVSYGDYEIGGSQIEFFLGPATVALGVPLYKNALKIKDCLSSVTTGVLVGAVMGIASSAALVWLFGGSQQLMVTMMPKSVTTAISVELVRYMGGMPELGSVLTVLTGLLGSMIGPEVLRWFGLRDDIPIGTAMGTSSHGIGTGRLIRESDLSGSISGFSMGLAGIITSLLLIPLHWLFHQ